MSLPADVDAETGPFLLMAPAQPRSPILVAVPHAGRHYPARAVAHARVPLQALQQLEDRHVDAVGLPLAESLGCSLLVANVARAVIDLNRHPSELDPAMVRELPEQQLAATAKVRGGLGLLPRRLGAWGELWQGPISLDEYLRRLATIHRPYHAALEGELDRLCRVFGAALLVDLHSMPPLLPANGQPAADIVLGNLHGRSSSAGLLAAGQAELSARGFRVAVNTPYAGGFDLAHHCRPRQHRHGLQIEISRDRYLDRDLHQPTAAARDVARRLAEALGSLAGNLLPRQAQAAE